MKREDLECVLRHTARKTLYRSFFYLRAHPELFADEAVSRAYEFNRKMIAERLEKSEPVTDEDMIQAYVQEFPAEDLQTPDLFYSDAQLFCDMFKKIDGACDD